MSRPIRYVNYAPRPNQHIRPQYLYDLIQGILLALLGVGLAIVVMA